MRKVMGILISIGVVISVLFGYWYTLQTNKTETTHMPEVQILTLHDCGTYDNVAVCNLLQNTGSTTQYFKQICPKNFNVLILSQTWRDTTHAEQARLHITHNTIAYVRQVLLRCGETNLMFAQSIFPEDTIQSTGSTFIEIGQRSLGEILFQDTATHRQEWELSQLKPSDNLFVQMQHYFEDTQQFLWQRKSLFYYQQHPLLLDEIYLPALLEPLRNA